MRKIMIPFLALVLLISYSCKSPKNKRQKEDFIANNPDFSKGILTPEILWTFSRIGEFSLSPDGNTAIYAKSDYSIKQNKSTRAFFLINLKTNTIYPFSDKPIKGYSPQWRPDGKKIAFLSPVDGKMQIFEATFGSKEIKQISDEETGISTFGYAPDMKHIFFTRDVKIRKTVQDKYSDLDKTSGKIITDLMFRHWDTWEDENFSHVFIADYNEKSSKITNAIDIMPNEPYDTPMKPFDGGENIAWSNSGLQLAYTCKKMEGTQYAISTNSDIYLYDLETKTTQNLSEGMNGYDKNPVFSPDDKNIVWESMKRDGFEADKNRIMVYNFQNEKTTNYSKDFDQNAGSFTWSKDGKELYFISGIKATYQLFKLNLIDTSFNQITVGDHNYMSYAINGNYALASRQSMSSPTELFKIDLSSGQQTQITFENKPILDKIKLGNVEKRWINTTDGKKMLTWVIYPPDFDPNKKYPTLLYCQGGPQSAVSQFFSYRWNFQMMAANGYIIVAPNRRGLPSFGQEWNDQISKDYGGQNMKDYFSAIDSLAKEPFVNQDKLGAVGASYGGFSVFWLAGHHNKRFKVFIAHDGIFDWVSMYGSTEELWFPTWDLGGSYWKPEAKNSYGASPHLFVKNWDTPIMIVQGGKDYRVPETQAFEAFTAAKLRGLDAKLLYFPDENHWVLQPQNGILWQREFFAWLDKYLK